MADVNDNPTWADLDLADFTQVSDLPTADNWFASPLTLRERSMLALMLEVKDKLEWYCKVFDEEIVAKWREEALASFNPSYLPPGYARAFEDNGSSLTVYGEERQTAISEKMFDHCIAELRDNAKAFQEKGFTPALDANACVFMSDTAVSADTKSRLVAGARRLEDGKDRQKDWHPGSDGKVLDLVHPSLFPLLYGRSRILLDETVPLEKCSLSAGKGVIFPRPDKPYDGFSQNFQWLPCQVDFDADGKGEISSYVNNLHPRGNGDIYTAVGDIVTASVPMWIETLISTKFLATHRIRNVGSGIDESLRSDHDPTTGDFEDPIAIAPDPEEYRSRHRVHARAHNYHVSEDNSRRALDDLKHPLKNPDVKITEEQVEDGKRGIESEADRIRKIFQEQGMQIIVKLANIHLTPEKPRYAGGSWHVEGQLNEHIAASALYYYDSDNVTPSHLSFREGIDRDMLQSQQYEQHFDEPLREIYGLSNPWGQAIQTVGQVLTREDRLLVFPNVLQHCVADFELADSTRPGHRKLLALFLVDPDLRIPSTREVPPQQREWWIKAMEEQASLTQRLPVELADRIMQNVDEFPITLTEAKELRDKLIEERKVFVDHQMNTYVENGFCFYDR